MITIVITHVYLQAQTQFTHLDSYNLKQPLLQSVGSQALIENVHYL